MGDGNRVLSFIVVDSRSDEHPDWVGTCFESINNQNIEIEPIIVNNIGRTKSIGECFNQGVREATGDWCVFVGDDDWVAPDYARTLLQYINSEHVKNSRVVNVATYMVAFNNDTGEKSAIARQSTGAWKRDYLLKHPFNEELKKGIDREYIEETIKRGDLTLIIEYYFGYFYRRHNDYRCAGDIIFSKKPADYYFVTSNRIFLHSITERLSKKVGGKNIFIDSSITPELAKQAKYIWVEWANDKAIDIANFKTDAKKILRLHAYEAFSQTLKYLDLNKYDVVIFIDPYIKEYVERQYGKVNGAVIIPNGVEVDKYMLDPCKQKNNKIAYAGYLSRKKGIGELILIATSLPEYEFHLAGRYQEDDIADWMNHSKPENVFVHNWKYEEKMNEFYQDKSFILNTSLRESQGMTMMEAALAGCKPLVRNWLGVEDVYPVKYIYDSLPRLKHLLEGSWNPEEYRNFVIENYHIDQIYPRIEELFESVEVC